MERKPSFNGSMEEYASKRFKDVKKGALGKKKASMKDMLQWQKGSLKKSLIKGDNKHGPTIFTCIQGYMGDRPHKEKDEMELVKNIIQIIIASPTPDERDEVYCQIIKQINNNPNTNSMYRGFDLLCIMIQYFPPSNDLEKPFSLWVAVQSGSKDPKLPDYAKFLSRKLPKAMAEGARGRVPGLAELKGLVDAPFKQAIFGSTLEEVMEIQKVIDQTLELPLVLTVLCKCVLDLKGDETEGIFRVPGDTAQVTALKIAIESGDYSCKGVDDPHVPASLLKLWMRELIYPIVPTELYDPAIESASKDDAQMAVKLVKEMPVINRKVLFYVILYLRGVGQPENVPKTKMGINNLAMVFAPNFLRCPSEDPSVIFNTQKHQQTFVRHLLQNLEEVDL